MNVVIVWVPLETSAQMDRFVDDLFELMDYADQHPERALRVVCDGWGRNGIPVYRKIPDDELTYIEWREQHADHTS